ncbi:efflux RND transporter periplasmic adaptor subunit [Amphritea balenae]|uniref:Efflux RND transporter periplasmic adaptor subunit n=2 Tax=Amphritea balenae TaxID=452629 RepID=A0A3P1STI5_9GAMM|nr:efflux RND transporter periplasmic adaptor subunit [Amphritea balenae]GGK85846.1 MexH family multidrug efflux RND transporter periplasmic adaptor subunit [Amphritea balenae]
MVKKMKFNQIFAPAIISIALLGSAAIQAEETKGPQGLPAEVIHVQSKPLTHVIEAVGTLRANESIILRPEQSGKVEKILFQEGASVTAGDPLLILESSLYQAQLQESKARVNLSRIAYKRAASLVKKRVGSQQDLDSSLAQLKVDQAQQELAQTRLDKMTIRTPFDGVIGLRQFSPGDYLNVGQDLVELTDLNTMKVDFRVPENQLANIRSGQKIKVLIDALPGESFDGSIYAISPSIDERGHNIAVRATIANRDNLLRPGLFARIQIITGTNDSAIMVPEEAIIPQNNSFFVMTVTDNTVGMAPVELGIRKAGEVNILSGLKGDEVIITAGQIKLFPGMPVTPIFVDGTGQQPGQTEQQPGA